MHLQASNNIKDSTDTKRNLNNARIRNGNEQKALAWQQPANR
jgi:hypothetical protein